MSGYSILVRDGRATERVDLQPESAGPRPSLPHSPAPILRSRSTPGATTVAAPEVAAPKVWMRLPDVSQCAATTMTSRFPLASQFYWAAIVLGALLAVALIWTGKKPPAREFDEAPAWSPATTGSVGGEGPSQGVAPATAENSDGATADVAARVSQAPAAKALPGGQLNPERSQPEGTDGQSLEGGQEPINSIPPADEGGPNVRTARGSAALSEAGSGQARPSEAIPLGINTTVEP